MKNSPEVTTALAVIAERCTRNEFFLLLPIISKFLVLHAIEIDLLEQFHVREEQRMEFLERYNDTIINPWCYEDLGNDAR